MSTLNANILGPQPGGSAGLNLFSDSGFNQAIPPVNAATRPEQVQSVAPVVVPQMRAFGDIAATRKAIYDRVYDVASKMQPISNDRFTMRFRDVQWADPDHFTKAQRKQAILSGGTLARRLRGTVDLIDNASGTPIDSKLVTLFRVPHLTDGGTFVQNGSEIALKNQQRLRAGAFTREKENGEIETHVNVLKGGPAHRYFIDPAKGVFYLKQGQSQIPLMPLLQSLGATEQEIRDAWGPDLYAVNYQKADAASLQKLSQRFVRKGKDTPEDPSQALRQAFEKMELDPDVNKHTLGNGFGKVDKDAVLAITKKLLAVSRKEAETDDRDHLAYQTFLGPEDLFAERIEKDRAGLRRQLLFKATGKGNLQWMNANVLQDQIDAALSESGLGQHLEEINPAEILDKLTQISRMGEGGIPSYDAIPDEARSVQPSHAMFMDPLRTPESFRAGVDLYMASNARKGTDGKLYAKFFDASTNQEVWKTPQEAGEQVIAFSNPHTQKPVTPPGMAESYAAAIQRRAIGRPSAQDEELIKAYEINQKTPGKRVPVMKNGRLTYAKRDEVNLVMPHFENAFSPLGNLIPLKSMVKGQRVAMASRMTTQALPLVGAEAPLVQSGVPGSNGQKSFEDEYGAHMGSIKADKGGKVIAVSPDAIKVQYDDGTTTDIELYDNMPYNRKSVTGDTVVYVKRKNGKVWIGPIANYARRSGDRVLSVNQATKRSSWEKVTGFICHPNDKQLYRVKTRSGRHVDVTEDHSLVTLDENGDLTPIYPLDCVPGMTRLPVAMMPTSHGKTEDVSLDLATLAGLYLAEGHLAKQPGLVSIAVDPPVRVAEVRSLCRRLGFTPHAAKRNATFTDHKTSQWLRSLFGAGSGDKFVSPDVLTWSHAARIALVQGYMAGDGCLWADTNGALQLTAVSTSKSLRDGMVEILSSLGVFVTLFDAPREYVNDAWADGYGFRVMSGHVDKLSRWFFYTDREKKLGQLVRKDTYRASVHEFVPTVGPVARKLLYAKQPNVDQYLYKTANQGKVAKWRLADNTGVFGKWGRSDVMWDEIESVLPLSYQETVYDFCVAGSEVFAVNNGLIVHNTSLTQTPVVRPGDTFRGGDLLARSNFTDGTGAAALGLNARVAYVPWGGKNFEDAIAISESMAGRFKSEHMYQHQLEVNDRTRVGKSAYVGLFPAKYARKTLDKLDDQGVIKVGQSVEYGDPLIVAAEERARTLNKLHRKGQAGFTDSSVTWTHHDPGVVTDVVQSKNGPVVVVKSQHAMQVGDKMSGRYGDKGIVSAIIPDSQMPHDQQGQPFEVLLNPLGVISRTNPSQWAESALGKIAAKLGRPIKVEDFDDNIQDRNEWVIEQLRQHGLSDTETIVDPNGEHNIPGVNTGMRFFMKLHHTAESKGQGRSGGSYSADETPAKGGETGAKRIALLDVNALLSHGATEVLRDAGAIRGQKNEDYWLQFMQGHTPRAPKVPMVYQKFVSELKASGINVVPEGSQLHVMAMTDKDIDKLAGDRNIDVADTVNFDSDLKPISGGLFDTTLTGGHHGNRWAAVQLAEPMPSPVMEEPIRRVLGLTKDKFEEVIAGRHKIHEETGPSAIANALGKLDLDREIASAQHLVRYGTKSKRDDAVRKLAYLKSAKRLGIHPADWMLKRAPVLPPQFRPINVMGGDKQVPLVADPNFLYKELIEANRALKEMQNTVGADNVGDERLAVYQAFKAVTGLGDPITQQSKEKQVRGLLKTIFGNSPKYGTVQRKLIASTVDNVGRAVISPNPDFDMDTVGLPEDRAFNVYQRFVVRRLKRSGLPMTEALRHVKEKTALARKTLVDEMEQRPVIINRAPVLHRFGIMAFRPVLVKGSTLQISPLIVKGFNADFDGDAMQYHVPVDDEARKEALDRMLPSRQLLSPSDFKSPVHVPGQEYVGGLYHASTHKTGKTRTFRNKVDAIKAWHRNEIDVGDTVNILEDK